MNKQPIEALTGLRFVAILLVCTAHLTPHLSISPSSFYDTMTRLSAEGMSLFFVLSGFVIHYNYSKLISSNPKAGLYRFFVSRFARLVPLYVCCVIYDIYSSGMHGGNYSSLHLSSLLMSIFPYYATLTQTWVYKIIGGTSLVYPLGHILPVSWSISTEWFFYLIYPLVCFGLLFAPKVRTKLNLLLLVMIYGFGAVALMTINLDVINQLAVQHYGSIADYYTHNQDSFFRWLIYFSPYSRCAEFLMGCLVAAIYMQLGPAYASSRRTQIMGTLLTVSSICFILLSHYCIWNPPSISALQWLPYLHRSFGFAPAFALVIFCCARYQNVITAALSSRVILFGGEISYSMYLLHLTLIEKVFNGRYQAYANSLSTIPRYFLMLGIIMGLSYLTYRIIEIPARQFIRKRFLTRQASPAVNSRLVTSAEAVN